MANKSLLEGITVGDLVGDKSRQEVFFVNDDTSVGDTLALLDKHRIISAPVWDKNKKEWSGIIGIVDIMGFVVFSSWSRDASDGTSMEKLREAASLDTPVSDVLGATAETSRLWNFRSSDSAQDVVEAMSKGVHRVLVDIDDKSHGVVLTQSDVVKYILNHRDKFPRDLFNAPLSNLGLASPAGDSGKIKRVCASTPAIQVFRTLFQDGLSAVPVEFGEGVANFKFQVSASDMRNTNKDNITDMLMPVGAFLNLRTGDKPAKPVTVNHFDSLEDTLTKLVGARIHRVWVVNSEENVAGVVTLSDILTKFSDFDFIEQTNK